MVEVLQQLKTVTRQFISFYDRESSVEYNLFGRKRVFSLIIAYSLACLGTFLLMLKILPLLSRTFREKLKYQQRLDWANRLVAALHATIMTYRATIFWTIVRPFTQQNWSAIKVSKTLSVYEKETMRLMTGYMVYDLFIEMTTPSHFDLPVIFHHVAGIASHVYTLATNDSASAFYTMLVYLAEASTPILHTGWMLNTLGMADTALFKLLTLLLLLVFFIVRIALSPLLAYGFLHPANRKLYDGRPGVWYFQLIIIFAFSTLNYFWFYKLVSLVIRKMRSARHLPDRPTELGQPDDRRYKDDKARKAD